MNLVRFASAFLLISFSNAHDHRQSAHDHRQRAPNDFSSINLESIENDGRPLFSTDLDDQINFSVAKYKGLNNPPSRLNSNKGLARRRNLQNLPYDFYDSDPDCLRLTDPHYCANYRAEQFSTWHERALLGYANHARRDPLGFAGAYGSISYKCDVGGSQRNPIFWSSELDQAARFHSWEMATENYFRTETSNKYARLFGSRYFFDRVMTFIGYGLSRTGAENIAAGFDRPYDTVRIWLSSEGSCKNIMDRDFGSSGSGFVSDVNSDHKRYSTQVYYTFLATQYPIVVGWHDRLGIVKKSLESMSTVRFFCQVKNRETQSDVSVVIDGVGYSMQHLGESNYIFDIHEDKIRSECSAYYFLASDESLGSNYRLPESESLSFQTYGIDGCNENILQNMVSSRAEFRGEPNFLTASPTMPLTDSPTRSRTMVSPTYSPVKGSTILQTGVPPTGSRTFYPTYYPTAAQTISPTTAFPVGIPTGPPTDSLTESPSIFRTSSPILQNNRTVSYPMGPQKAIPIVLATDPPAQSSSSPTAQKMLSTAAFPVGIPTGTPTDSLTERPSIFRTASPMLQNRTVYSNAVPTVLATDPAVSSSLAPPKYSHAPRIHTDDASPTLPPPPLHTKNSTRSCLDTHGVRRGIERWTAEDGAASTFKKYGYISDWRTCNLTSARSLFSGLALFDEPIGGWDTSKVTDMSKIFKSASAFDRDLSSWDTSACTTLRSAFYSAVSFNGDISSWDTSRVVSMSDCFWDAVSFNIDISGWDTSNTKRFGGAFAGAIVFNINLSEWDISNAKTMHAMFNWAEGFNQRLCWSPPGNVNTFMMFLKSGGEFGCTNDDS